uniref:Retrotransposon protein, putative, unclassified n=1 Tax=Oryza sativa subsp. japonica TaxID=39947 RepID=Q2QR95_ORYSJ|nr:retrotransposon protein, putative, unclassified [Oryza sativa Japonica Group]
MAEERERESFESQWAPSDVTEENLKEMVARGVLPAKEIIGWRPACGEAFPTPDTHEVMGILEFYGISLHHLNSNSIVHIANFIHACEAFLGVRPHFALFRRIFFLKPQSNKNKPCVVGGAGFQLRGTLSQKYFSMPFKTSNKGWHANWFYVQNPKPALPEYSCLPPVYQDTWNSLPMEEEATQALALMDRMLKLKEQGPQGEQITRHFIKSRLAPIKERSRMAFEFDGKHDPNREDLESLEFKVMKERMYKIFSNAIVVSYSHLLPVVPYNAFKPPPPEFALMKSDPPTAQRRSPRWQTGQAGGGPKIRKPSDIDPSGKDSEPTDMETGPTKEIGPTAEDRPSDNQPATDNVETSDEPPTGNQSAEAGVGANQEPPTGNQSGAEQNNDIPEVETQADSRHKTSAGANSGTNSPIRVQGPARPRQEIITGPMVGDEEVVLWIQSAEDSRPPILVKWWDDEMQPQGIVINKEKEDEKVCLLKKTLGQATCLVNRIHLRNEAKTATLEKLVPHLGTLEATRNQLHEAKELARKTEHDLRDRITELQDFNFELSGSSKVQAAKIYVLEKRIQALEKDKAELARQRDLALKDVEGLREVEMKVANAATPLVQAMFFNNNGPSTFDASEIFDKLRIAPDTYFKKIKEVGSMGASLALAMTKSLYPKINIDTVDGFVDRTSEETALDLINDAQKAADKIAVDVVERFQDNDLRPTGSNNSDDEKTDTD